MLPEGIHDEIGVPVRAGKYEVNLSTRTMKPSYWPAPHHRVLRGSWFAEKGSGEWMPLRETLADQLEQAYKSCIWRHDSGLPHETQIDGRIATKLELTAVAGYGCQMHALWYGPEEAFVVVKESGFNWLRSPPCLRLRRGYQTPDISAVLSKEADVEAEKVHDHAAVTPPTHLVIVVHGIGQTLQGANIAGDAQSLLNGIMQVEPPPVSSCSRGQSSSEATQEPSSSNKENPDTSPTSKDPLQPDDQITCSGTSRSRDSGTKTRIEVLPVQWRRTMNLHVDELAAALRPPGIPALRSILHSTAVEVLHYLTPIHRAAMLASLVTCLNSVFARFMLRNPEFSGPVTIVAHSLGSVLCWDILCNCKCSFPPSFQETTPASVSPEHIQSQMGAPDPLPLAWDPPPIDLAPLNFAVDVLILVGSPLGCFLALRGIDVAQNRGLGSPNSARIMQLHPGIKPMEDGLPAVRRLYNLYHPFDSVAYRLEPLAYIPDVLEGKRTALAPLFHGGKRVHLAVQELGDAVTGAAGWLWRSKRKEQKREGQGAQVAVSKTEGASRDTNSTGDVPISSNVVEAGNEAKDSDESKSMLLEAEKEDGIAFGPLGMVSKEEGTDQGDGVTQMNEFGEEGAARSVIRRVTDGPLPRGKGWPRTATGHLDFVLQESTVENQYLSALSAHFIYWSSLDVALFVHRAATGRDVISGEPLTKAEGQNDGSG